MNGLTTIAAIPSKGGAGMAARGETNTRPKTPETGMVWVSVSTYGAGIPTIYGQARLGGLITSPTSRLEMVDFSASEGASDRAPVRTMEDYARELAWSRNQR